MGAAGGDLVGDVLVAADEGARPDGDRLGDESVGGEGGGRLAGAKEEVEEAGRVIGAVGGVGGDGLEGGGEGGLEGEPERLNQKKKKGQRCPGELGEKVLNG